MQARAPKLQHFNKGNVGFELLVKETTILSTLGTFEPTVCISTPTRVEFCEIINISTRICKFLLLYVFSSLNLFFIFSASNLTYDIVSKKCLRTFNYLIKAILLEVAIL